MVDYRPTLLPAAPNLQAPHLHKGSGIPDAAGSMMVRKRCPPLMRLPCATDRVDEVARGESDVPRSSDDGTIKLEPAAPPASTSDQSTI